MEIKPATQRLTLLRNAEFPKRERLSYGKEDIKEGHVGGMLVLQSRSPLDCETMTWKLPSEAGKGGKHCQWRETI